VRKQEPLKAPAVEGKILRAIAGNRPKKLPLTPDPSPPRHFVFAGHKPPQARGRGEPIRPRCGKMAAGARALAGLAIGDSHGGEVTLVLGLVQQDTSPALPHARRRTSGRATPPTTLS